jgi:hypothetical protein
MCSFFNKFILTGISPRSKTSSRKAIFLRAKLQFPDVLKTSTTLPRCDKDSGALTEKLYKVFVKEGISRVLWNCAAL